MHLTGKSPKWRPEWPHVFHFLLQMVVILKQIGFYTKPGISRAPFMSNIGVVRILIIVPILKYLIIKN